MLIQTGDDLPHAHAARHVRRHKESRHGCQDADSIHSDCPPVHAPAAARRVGRFFASSSPLSQPISSITTSTGSPRRRTNSANASTRLTLSRSACCAKARYSSNSFAVSVLCSLLAISRLSRRASAAGKRIWVVRINAASSSACSPFCCCHFENCRPNSRNSAGDNCLTAAIRCSTVS